MTSDVRKWMSPVAGFLLLLGIACTIAAVMAVGTGRVPAHVVAQISPISQTGSREADWQVNAERLNSFSSAEIDELKRKKTTFDNWPEHKRQQIRQLHEQIMQHPRRDELLAVMDRYFDWVKQLPMKQRQLINEKPPAERVAAVEKIREEQATKMFGLVNNTFLPQSDFKILFNWIGDILDRKRSDMIATLQKRFEQNQVRQTPRNRSSWDRIGNERLFRAFIQFVPDEARELITDEDVQELRDRLSPNGQQTLDAMPDDQKRRQLVGDWIRAAVYSLRDPRALDQLNTEFDEELDRFYQNEMTQEQRDRVDDGMYAKTRQREIAKLYFQSRINTPASSRDSQRRSDDQSRSPENRPGSGN